MISASFLIICGEQFLTGANFSSFYTVSAPCDHLDLIYKDPLLLVDSGINKLTYQILQTYTPDRRRIDVTALIEERLNLWLVQKNKFSLIPE